MVGEKLDCVEPADDDDDNDEIEEARASGFGEVASSVCMKAPLNIDTHAAAMGFDCLDDEEELMKDRPQSTRYKVGQTMFSNSQQTKGKKSTTMRCCSL